MRNSSGKRAILKNEYSFWKVSDDLFAEILRSERCKSANLLDFVNRFHTSIYLQTSASIQPRTGLSKFGGDLIHFFIRLLTRDCKRVSSAQMMTCERLLRRISERCSRIFQNLCRSSARFLYKVRWLSVIHGFLWNSGKTSWLKAHRRTLPRSGWSTRVEPRKMANSRSRARSAALSTMFVLTPI